MLPPANDCSAQAACNIHAHMFSEARSGLSISTSLSVVVGCLLLLSVRFPRHSAGSTMLSQISTSVRGFHVFCSESEQARGGRVYSMVCRVRFPAAGRRRWRDRLASACSSSTVSPHGLLPPSSFYSLLLGDASLSPKVTQAKTPLSSFARAGYQGNSAVPPLLFCTHLLSSFFLLQSPPSLPSPPLLQL